MVDFKEHLRRQLRYLETSCEVFDQNRTDEAPRIAVILRVLFHDTSKSTSLLKRLGAKSIVMLSTADAYNKPQLLNLALVHGTIQVASCGQTFLGVECKMQPLLGKAERREIIPLHAWWSKEIIIEANGGANKLNRRDLICAAANKDGGAHVDSVLEPTYNLARLGAGVSVEVRLTNGQPPVEVPFEDVHYASIRQVAYEVLNSPALLTLAE